MPSQIDEEKMSSGDLKVLDINNPPLKHVPHQNYPKIVYLHPKDKTKEHRFLVVNNADEHDDAAKKGYKTQPHIPVEGPDAELADFEGFEADTEEEAEPARRGPGRPRAVQQ